jgi:ketosteroid isomerase-like protein
MATVKEDVTRAIRANDDEFERCIRAKDAQRLVQAFYEEGASFMAPNQPALVGRAAIAGMLGALFGMGLREIKLEISGVEVSGDMAAEVGRYTMTVGEGQDRGKYVVVHRRQPDGSWKAFADIFNSDLPAH